MEILFIKTLSASLLQKVKANQCFVHKATPIYLLVLRAQEVGNEPFWNKKKVEKCDFLNFFNFF